MPDEESGKGAASTVGAPAKSKHESSTNRAQAGASVRRGDVVLFRWSGHEALASVEERGTKVEGLGVFKEGTLVGTPFGGSVKVGAQEVHLLRPSLPDFVRLLKRGAQIITLKDAALILANSSIGAGARVVEFGVGSGALTISILHAVGPAGRLISVDNNPKHIDVARKNVGRTPWGTWWEVREGDCKAGIPEDDADALVIDIPDPWEAIGASSRALGASGRLASYSPTINQAERMHVALERAGFGDVRTLEALEREHAVREGATRPQFDILGHTGYLTFARKLQ